MGLFRGSGGSGAESSGVDAMVSGSGWVEGIEMVPLWGMGFDFQGSVLDRRQEYLRHQG